MQIHTRIHRITRYHGMLCFDVNVGHSMTVILFPRNQKYPICLCHNRETLTLRKLFRKLPSCWLFVWVGYVMD